MLLAVLALIAAKASAADDGYQRALPGYEFRFPRDHGSHPDFRTEWWYFTGNVQDEWGKPFGFKMTIFRSATAPPEGRVESALAANQVYLCHFAISDVAGRDHQAWETVGREGFDQARASTVNLDVGLKDFSILMAPDETITLKAGKDHAGLDLKLSPAKPFVIHGEKGIHQKADIAGQASHYITYTRLNTTGTLRWRDKAYTVSGLSWMDHEFGSDYLSDSQAGWDWFAIQLDNGYDLMLYQLRNKDGSANTHSIGSIVDKQGNLTPIRGSDFVIEQTGSWESPKTGGVYPMGWKIRLRQQDSLLTITPAFPDQEMVMQDYTRTAYWEGAVRIGGTWGDSSTAGKGYVELVGYAGSFDLL